MTKDEVWNNRVPISEPDITITREYLVCHICNKKGGTLLKDGDKYIHKSCQKKPILVFN